MARLLDNIITVSTALKDSAAKRRRLAALLKKNGFLALGKGAWLGLLGKDIASGILIEGSPSDIYLTSFVLPIFDKMDFISWSLGRRMVNCMPDRNVDQECEEAVSTYRSEILPVRSADNLISYINEFKIDGFYPLWATYLSHLRKGELKVAEQYLTDDMTVNFHPLTLAKLEELKNLVSNRDLSGVMEALSSWEAVSRKLFGDNDYDIESRSLV